MSVMAGLDLIEVTDSGRSDADDDIEHIVCHCTDDNIAACRLDVTDANWTEAPDEQVCALCLWAWPDDAPTCPWGCSCEECGPAHLCNP